MSLAGQTLYKYFLWIYLFDSSHYKNMTNMVNSNAYKGNAGQYTYCLQTESDVYCYSFTANHVLQRNGLLAQLTLNRSQRPVQDSTWFVNALTQ